MPFTGLIPPSISQLYSIPHMTLHVKLLLSRILSAHAAMVQVFAKAHSAYRHRAAKSWGAQGAKQRGLLYPSFPEMIVPDTCPKKSAMAYIPRDEVLNTISARSYQQMSSCPFACLQGLLRWMRNRGLRINLRPAAELQMLAWLLIGGSVFTYSLKILIGLALALGHAIIGQNQSASTSLVPVDPHQELAQIEQQLTHMVSSR